MWAQPYLCNVGYGRRNRTCFTGGVSLGRRRGSIPFPFRRGGGGEVAPTENGGTSDGPSHSPLLSNEAVPALQNARRAAGSSGQPKIPCSPYLGGPRKVIRLSVQRRCL